MAFKAPYFSPETLRRKAADFLLEHHPSGTIPVPIEKIVDIRLGIDIVPMPGFDNFDTVAFISHDLQEIWVDDFVYRRRPNRYRFSLAHEIGHRVLHADLFEQFRFSGIEDWIRFASEEISEVEYRFLEFHANCFAGLVLVPPEQLRDSFFDYVEKGQDHGIDFDKPGTGAREVVEEHIARVFEVSADVVHRRIEFEELWHND